jgi:hypothetical protein
VSAIFLYLSADAPSARSTHICPGDIDDLLPAVIGDRRAPCDTYISGHFVHLDSHCHADSSHTAWEPLGHSSIAFDRAANHLRLPDHSTIRPIIAPHKGSADNKDPPLLLAGRTPDRYLAAHLFRHESGLLAGLVSRCSFFVSEVNIGWST